MKNVNVTLIANRCRATDWLPQIYSKAPPSGQNYFRSDFKTVKIANNLRKVREIDEKCQYNTIANRCRATDWLPQIYSEVARSGQNYFRFISSVKVSVTEMKT